MKRFLIYTFIFFALTIFFSCIDFNQKSRKKTERDPEKENLSEPDQSITGEWRFESVTKQNSDDDYSEEENREKEQMNNNIIVFKKNGRYYSLRETIDTLEVGMYEIIRNGRFLVTESGHRDTVKILELTSNSLKIETPGKLITTLKKNKEQ